MISLVVFIHILKFVAILSVLIIVHEFGHFIVSKKVGVRVEQFSLGFGKVLLRKKKGDTEYSIAAVPLGGFVKLAGDNLEEYSGKPDEYFSAPPGKRFWIIFCGPLLNYIFSILLFWMIFFVGYPSLTTKIGSFVDGYGAQEAGLKVGDKITAVEGDKVENWEDLQKIIYTKQLADSVKVTAVREGKEFQVVVKLKENTVEDVIGQKRKYGLLGITPLGERIKVRHGFIESLGLGFAKTIDITVLTYKAFGRLATGKLSMRESMTGPLGIFFITTKAVGVIDVFYLMAVLSLSLAIFNLLPLPILDGGHIFLLGLEKIRKKSLSVKSDEVVNKIGLTFIVFLAVLVTYNDIVRNFGDKISKLFIK